MQSTAGDQTQYINYTSVVPIASLKRLSQLRFDSSSIVYVYSSSIHSIPYVHLSSIRARFDSIRGSYGVTRAWLATTPFENEKN